MKAGGKENSVLLLMHHPLVLCGVKHRL